jgi:hypothetical protein
MILEMVPAILALLSKDRRARLRALDFESRMG